MSWPNMDKKAKIGLIWKGEKRERRERERKEEEGGAKIKQSQAPKRYGTIWFCMDFLSRYVFVGYGL